MDPRSPGEHPGSPQGASVNRQGKNANFIHTYTQTHPSFCLRAHTHIRTHTDTLNFRPSHIYRAQSVQITCCMNGFHFPRCFPWFSVSRDFGPLHWFPLSWAFTVVLQSPRNLGLYTSFRFPGRFPWFCKVPGIWASVVCAPPQIYSPRRFPCSCSAPGFWASTTLSTS